MTIGVALIGFGYAGRTFHAPLITALPEFSIKVVASSDPGKVLAHLPDMVIACDPQAAMARPDVDLVVIATPNDSHAPLAKAAIALGKNVVIDKPLAPSLNEAREICQLAEIAGVTLSVFHNRRWDSDFLGVAKAIRDGKLGDVSHFESHFDRFRPLVRDRWRENAGPASGVWWDLGPHLVDQALMLFGVPDRVMGSMATQRSAAQAHDWAHVVLEYPALRVILHAGMLVAGGTNRFTVHGTLGSLTKCAMDQQETQLLSGLKPGAVGWGEDPDPFTFYQESGVERSVTPVGDQREYYRQLALALSGQATANVSAVQALAVMAVVEAANNSAVSSRYLQPTLTAAESSAF